MSARPYHHGGLREAMLERAQATLRDSGVDGLSLRELARDIGVSHGAPRRHFRDKGALLDALALDGFRRLGEILGEVASAESPTFAETLTDVAVAYVEFATANPALLELMFTSKHRADASVELHQAANASFDRVAALVKRGQVAGELVEGDLHQIGLLLLATLQGITSLANTEMIDSTELGQLTAYSVQSLLLGLMPRDSARKPLSSPTSTDR